MPHFDGPNIYIAVENIVRQGEIACNKKFLLFSHNVFHLIWHLFSILNALKMLSAISLNLEQSKILLSRNGLTLYQTAWF